MPPGTPSLHEGFILRLVARWLRVLAREHHRKESLALVTEWAQVLVMSKTDMGPISRLYKKFLQTRKKDSNPKGKMGRRYEHAIYRIDNTKS